MSIILIGGLLVGISLIDISAVIAEITAADPWLLSGALGAVILTLFAWAEAQRVLLTVSNETVGVRRNLAIFWAAMVPRLLFPIGDAAAFAMLAFFYDRELDASYQAIAAPVLVAEVLNIAASTVLAISGGLVLLFALGAKPAILVAVIGAVSLTAGGIALVLLYQVPLVALAKRARARLLRAEGNLSGHLARHLNSLRSIHGFAEFRSAFAESVDRRRLVYASGLLLVGWVAFASSLSLSALALGHQMRFAVSLFVVPIVGYANLLPLPGGLGGYEAALVGLLLWLTGIDPVGAVAVTVVFRLVSYWFVVLAGGVFALFLSIDFGQLTRDVTRPAK